MHKKNQGRTVLTPTEARQGRRVGVQRILATSLALALVAAILVYGYFWSLW